MHKYFSSKFVESMKLHPLLFTFLATAFISLSAITPEKSDWKLVWEENFDTPELDSSVWRKIPRGTADWDNYMSSADSLYALNNGILTLRGTVNGNPQADTATYLTGGIWTKGTKAFEPGRIVVRARFKSAKGAWPAIWLLPFDTINGKWPNGGEIDIMEHLNHDTIAYQTVHSYYTLNLGGHDFPPRFGTPQIDREGWNEYGVDITPDSIAFHTNGVISHVYPRIDSLEHQFPFYIPQYILIDMQLQGGWVGEVNPQELPAIMEIDWVRHYIHR